MSSKSDEMGDEVHEAWETIEAVDVRSLEASPEVERTGVVESQTSRYIPVNETEAVASSSDDVVKDAGSMDQTTIIPNAEDKVVSESSNVVVDEENHTHWAINILTLCLFTGLVVAIPLAVLNNTALWNRAKEANLTEWVGRLLKMNASEISPSEWIGKLPKMITVKSDDDDDDDSSFRDNPSDNYTWRSPLSEKEFHSSILGDDALEELQAEHRDAEQGKSPLFDFFDGGVWNDANQQDFVRGVGNFFKRKQGSQSESSMEQMITDLLAQKAESTTKHEQESFVNMVRLLQESGQEVFRQFNQTFGHVGLDRFNLLQFLYYMEYDEARRNAVWKRKMHRFQPELPDEAAIQLFDGLYLSQLAYAPTCEEIFHRLESFRGGLFKLRNCTVEASVNRPAHFLAIRKMDDPRANVKDELLSNFDVDNEKGFRRRFARSWLSRALNYVRPSRQRIQVIVVIRGSKEVFDFLTDAHLVATDFQGGKAHDGILQSSQWLIDLYSDDLKRLSRKLRPKNGKKIMKLWFVGHSLGGGTAALAAMLFHERKQYAKWIDAEAIGFGTPSLVSPELSYQYQDIVTTVVNDADVVPRTSGAALARTFLKIVRYNWTEAALEDYDQLVNVLMQDQNIMKHFFGTDQSKAWLQDQTINLRIWLEQWFDENVAPFLDERLAAQDTDDEGDEVELIPPGECIHLYRDGVSYQGNYVNCSFFGKDIEVVRHFVDDHLIPPGYYTALLGLVRNRFQNLNWTFDVDLMEIDYK